MAGNPLSLLGWKSPRVELPKVKTKILILLHYKSKDQEITYITESSFYISESGRHFWSSPVSSWNEEYIVAWTYFTFPELHLKEG